MNAPKNIDFLKLFRLNQFKSLTIILQIETDLCQLNSIAFANRYHSKNSFLIVLKGLLTTKMFLKPRKMVSKKLKYLFPLLMRSSVQMDTPGFCATDPHFVRMMTFPTALSRRTSKIMKTENHPKNFM